MKKWNAPEVEELNISETANGIINIEWEGPLDLVFGDRGDPSHPSSPDTDPVNPMS